MAMELAPVKFPAYNVYVIYSCPIFLLSHIFVTLASIFKTPPFRRIQLVLADAFQKESKDNDRRSELGDYLRDSFTR